MTIDKQIWIIGHDIFVTVVTDKQQHKSLDIYSMQKRFDEAELTKQNDESIILSKTSTKESVIKAFKFGKYLVFETEEVDRGA